MTFNQWNGKIGRLIRDAKLGKSPLSSSEMLQLYNEGRSPQYVVHIIYKRWERLWADLLFGFKK